MGSMIIFGLMADIAGVVGSKWALTVQKIRPREFNSLLFWFLALFSGVAFYLFGYADWYEALGVKNLLLLAGVIFIAFGWNHLNTEALKHEKLDNYELIVMSAPLFTILLSSLFLAAERDGRQIIAGLIVSLTLIATHFKKSHFDWKKYDRWLLAAVGLMALEAVWLKFLLAAWSPAALYFVRVLGVAVLFTWYFPPRLRRLDHKKIRTLVGLGLAGAIFKIIQYTGYDQLGVIITTMIFVLSPFAVLIADKLILKEKIHPKFIIGIIIIAATIAWILIGRG